MIHGKDEFHKHLECRKDLDLHPAFFLIIKRIYIVVFVERSSATSETIVTFNTKRFYGRIW